MPQAIEASTDTGALLISVRAVEDVSGSDPLSPLHGMPMKCREGSSTIHGTPKYSN